ITHQGGRSDARGPENRERIDGSSARVMDPLRLHSIHARVQDDLHAAPLEEAMHVDRVVGPGGRNHAASSLEHHHREIGGQEAGVAGKEGLACHLDQLGPDLDSGDAAPHDDEREKPAALFQRFGLLRHLEEFDHARAERHRVDDRLERPRVLFGTRDAVVIRRAPDRDHEHVERLGQVVVEMHLASNEIDSGRLVLVEADVAVARHLAKGIDDVARLDRADRDRGKEGVELEEVLLVDEERVPVLAGGAGLPDRPRHVESGEAATEDDQPLSRHAEKIALWLFAGSPLAYLSRRWTTTKTMPIWSGDSPLGTSARWTRSSIVTPRPSLRSPHESCATAPRRRTSSRIRGFRSGATRPPTMHAAGPSRPGPDRSFDRAPWIGPRSWRRVATSRRPAARPIRPPPRMPTTHCRPHRPYRAPPSRGV